MIKNNLIIGLLLALLLPQTAGAASSYTENWTINDFNSEITINENGSIDVVETIHADFSKESHRGIERSIPYKRDDRNIRIKFDEVTDENDREWKTSTNRKNGNLLIQATSRDGMSLTGEETFTFKYTVKNAINYFDEHDELFWNVNGTQWVVASGDVSAKINLPEELHPNDTQIACFTGSIGSKASECVTSEKNPGEMLFATIRTLGPYENLTIVAGIPKGIITPPSGLSKILRTIQDNYGVFIPIFAFIIMYNLWYRKGRDDRTVRDTIIPHYRAPKNLRPSETGTIIDEKLDPRDITATIIDFAVRGFIKIRETEKKGNFELELIKPYETTKTFEKHVLKGIFPKNVKGTITSTKDLKNKFYKTAKIVKKEIMAQLIKDDYFPHDPMKVKAVYFGIGVAINVIGGQFGAIFPVHILIGIMASGGVVIGFSFFMARKTRKGTETYYELKGLYEYINTAEKDRMKFQEKNNIMFEKLLPYAMSFGLIKKWTRAFDGIINTPPRWYSPHHGWTNFSMHSFSKNLDKFSSKATQHISSQPGGKGSAWSGGSGFGGGFSGGGFGGGGGRGL